MNTAEEEYWWWFYGPSAADMWGTYPRQCECEGAHVNDIVAADGTVRHQHDSPKWGPGPGPFDKAVEV